MRGLAGILIGLGVSACGFHTPANDQGGGGGGGGGGDDMPAPDAAVDADPGEAPVDLPLYAASGNTIFKLDVDQKTSTEVGEVSDDGWTISVDGLALYGHTLIGLSDGGDHLIVIDKETGKVTSTMDLSPADSYGGLTVVPAGDLGTTSVVFTGKVNDGKLYRIDPTNGAVTAVGPFTGNYRFFSDLAWVHGAGLFATLAGGTCADVCFARIDPATGAATIFRSNLGTNLYGLSGYRDKLWAFNNAGPVLTVNQTTGLMAMEFDPQVPWTEAAQ